MRIRTAVLLLSAVLAAACTDTSHAHRAATTAIPRHTAPTPPATKAPTAPPPGEQFVSFHGVQIRVPAGWRLEATECGTPIADTVIPEESGGTGACFRPPVAGLTVVYLSRINDMQGQQLAVVATTPATVDGHPVRRGRGRVRGFDEPVTSLVMPDPGVVVAVQSPTAAAADRILATASVVSVDANGCAAHVTSLRPTAYASAPTLAPANPAAGSICRYADDWLARSVALTPRLRARMVGVLNALRPGVSRAGGDFSEASSECSADEHRGFVVRLWSPSGVDDVYVHIGGCGALSASNGGRTAKIDAPLVQLLTSLVSYDGGFPDPSTLN